MKKWWSPGIYNDVLFFILSPNEVTDNNIKFLHLKSMFMQKYSQLNKVRTHSDLDIVSRSFLRISENGNCIGIIQPVKGNLICN